MALSEDVLLRFTSLHIYEDPTSEKTITKSMSSTAGFENAMNIWKQVVTL